MHDDELLTVPQAMARLKISRSALYDLIRTRNLASLTIGRARRIPAHALDDYIQRHLEEAAR
ncbi:helix-turn-helix domain-containing protein [Streptomyces sp. NPDC050549]|uniref:helix-turn-helix domain-containing protein n=1 Tax=Streptomyces sp. NPDC050549 TaxID=3155406 RepID=UPI003435AA03